MTSGIPVQYKIALTAAFAMVAGVAIVQPIYNKLAKSSAQVATSEQPSIK